MSGSKCSNDILIFCHTFTLSISIPVSALTSSEFVSFSGSSLHMTERGPVQSLSTQSLMFMTPETKTSSLSWFHLPSLLEACLLCLSGCEIILWIECHRQRAGVWQPGQMLIPEAKSGWGNMTESPYSPWDGEQAINNKATNKKRGPEQTQTTHIHQLKQLKEIWIGREIGVKS